MKNRFIIPTLFSALILAGCNFANVLPTSNPTQSSVSTSESSEATSDSGTNAGSNTTVTTAPTSTGTTNTSTTTTSSGTSHTSTSTPSSTSTQPQPTVTSVTVTPNTSKVKQGESVTLSAKVNGTNNPSQSVTWKSSNTSAATVSNGVVTVKSTATAGTKVTITATSVLNTSKSGTATITVESAVTPSDKAKYTVMLYVCGSTLEYDGGVVGAASEDIAEILSCSNQPSDVNIILQTGGAKGWQNSSINKNYMQRFYVRNKSLNFVENAGDYTSTKNKANMSTTASLESFLTWGVENYPADKYGIVFWNHGGAVSGVCSDEYNGGDTLTTSEVAAAMKNTIDRTDATKFEWVGYDACIMNYLDNASVLADYCNYLVGSQELENGEGWDYTGWIPTLYSSPTGATTTLLKKICDSFVSYYDQYVGQYYSDGTAFVNDQCLSVLDLSKMGTFTNEFNSYTANFTTQSHYSSITSAFDSSLEFGDGCYGIADFSSFMTQMKKKFTSYSTTNLENAYSNLVAYSKYGSAYSSSSHPTGSNVFVAHSSDWYYGLQESKSQYTASDTKFTAWRNLMIKYGELR